MLGGTDKASRRRGRAVVGLGGRTVKIGVSVFGLTERLNMRERASGIKRVISARASSSSCKSALMVVCCQRHTHIGPKKMARLIARVRLGSRDDITNCLYSVGGSHGQLVISRLLSSVVGVLSRTVASWKTFEMGSSLTGVPCPVAHDLYTPLSPSLLTPLTSLCLPSSNGCTSGSGREKKR